MTDLSRSKQYAHWLYNLITDGDGDPEDAFNMMRKDGFIDENDEWKYDG